MLSFICRDEGQMKISIYRLGERGKGQVIDRRMDRSELERLMDWQEDCSDGHRVTFDLPSQEYICLKHLSHFWGSKTEFLCSFDVSVLDLIWIIALSFAFSVTVIVGVVFYSVSLWFHLLRFCGRRWTLWATALNPAAWLVAPCKGRLCKARSVIAADGSC